MHHINVTAIGGGQGDRRIRLHHSSQLRDPSRYAVNACNRAKPIFAEARGVQNNPPRSQVLRNSSSNPVDNTVKKENRTGAGRA
jgi:hypothetical protein